VRHTRDRIAGGKRSRDHRRRGDGFVCQFEDELVCAVDRLSDLNRAACRAEAERRFSPAAMADAYERVYADLCESIWVRELAVYA